MTKKKLIEYCQKKKIFLPPKPSKEYLIMAIVRANAHERKREGECYGFWEFENMTCTTCDLEKKCFKASIGMEKGEFFEALEKAENPRLRFTERLRKKKL